MKVVSFLISLYILIKPFYLWSSGLPQISDIVLAIAFIVVLFVAPRNSIFQIIKENKLFIVFLFFTSIINFFYFVFYSDGAYLLHGLYYVFDAIGIITFVLCMKNKKGFEKILSNSFKMSLILQLIIFLLGIGRYYANTRYMGTFNDPNQFAYYCFLSFGFIFLLSLKERKKTDLFFFMLTLFLVFESSSTGMLVGMSVFAFLYLTPALSRVIRNLRQYIIPFITATILLVGGVVVVASSPSGLSFFSDSPIITRVEQKLSRMEGNDKIDLWQERGYDRIYHYPYYILFGAGEGGYWRFEKAYHQYEMHATFPSLLFCYGIIPTCFVVMWVYKKLKGQLFLTLSIYLALLLESFTLINSRQVLFWVIFALAPFLVVKEKQLLEDKNG